MASGKKLSTRLYALRKKFPGVSQREMAAHFNLKLRMYQRYETGEVEPEEYKLRKIEQRIDFLDRLQTLPPINYEQSPKKSNVVTPNYVSFSGDINAELQRKDMEIAALNEEINSMKGTIEHLNFLIVLLKSDIAQLQPKKQPT